MLLQGQWFCIFSKVKQEATALILITRAKFYLQFSYSFFIPALPQNKNYEKSSFKDQKKKKYKNKIEVPTSLLSGLRTRTRRTRQFLPNSNSKNKNF